MEIELQHIFDSLSLSNREVSSFFWILVLFLVAMCIKVLREGLFAVLKVIFMRRMRRWTLLMVLFTSFICVGLHEIHVWSFADLKLTVLWLLTAGFYMLYEAVKDEPSPKQLIGRTFRNGFSIAVILEFLVGSVELPFLIAFFLIPIAGFFTLISGRSDTENLHEALGRRFANIVLMAIGWGLFFYAAKVSICGQSVPAICG